jgi:hypothetical protein
MSALSSLLVLEFYVDHTPEVTPRNLVAFDSGGGLSVLWTTTQWKWKTGT